MGPIFRSISVTLVDFLGTFIPGMAWVILLWEILYRFQQESCPKGFSLDIIIYPNNSPDISLSAFYFSFISLAIIVGYLVKSLGLSSVERIAAFAAFFYCKFNGLTLNKFGLDDRFRIKRNCESSEIHKTIYLEFPYNENYKYQKYFLTVNELIKLVTSIETRDLPGTQPFASCKRLLKIYCPSLWDEAESYEAQVRLLGSTLFAATGFLLYIPLYGLYCQEISRSTIFIFIVSLFLWFVLAYGFRKMRRREVKYMYLKILLAKKLILKKISEDNL